MSRIRPLISFILIAGLTGCGAKQAAAPLYESVPVERRTITVAVEASGTVEPVTTVEVKSKASGEILEVTAETGDRVGGEQLLVRIDPRTARNRLAQAEAELKAAIARRAIALTQKERAERLLPSGTLTQVDYEQTALEFANAEAQVVANQVAVENARIALEDTEIRAPIDGTLIEKHVEQGQVISSPTQDVGGGTLLLKMADLSQVQVRVLVDETDIGKVRAGLPATVTVAAFPNQPFAGEVLKIEPQAVLVQNVTMFAVLVSLDNRAGLLNPGMNAEVTIDVAQREDVLSIPVMAIRTDRDLETTAAILGVTEGALREQLASNALPEDPAPEGRAVQIAPEGSSARAAGRYRFGGRFWVVAERGDTYQARPVRTGITDLEHAEILAGLTEADRVLMLPSSHLIETQAELQSFISRRVGVPGMRRQQER